MNQNQSSDEALAGESETVSPISHALRFGVFPLGIAGTPDGLASGLPDDQGEIAAALDGLRGDGRSWLVRMYTVWTGEDSSRDCLAQLAELATWPTDLAVVLNYMDRAGNVESWLDFLTEVVRAWGDRFSTLQVTGEPNLTGMGTDGDFPRIAEALVRGVITAATVKRDHGATVDVGFAAAFEPRPETNMLWPRIRQMGGHEFCGALDYSGIDMYPDVFGPPLSLERLGEAVGLMLKLFRERVLKPIGVAPTVPLHICENGWPTGSQRSEERQADALETIVRNLHALREDLNITHWELFTLRDADSSKDDLFHQFGILRDDYTPKPAFDRLLRLYAELG